MKTTKYLVFRGIAEYSIGSFRSMIGEIKYFVKIVFENNFGMNLFWTKFEGEPPTGQFVVHFPYIFRLTTASSDRANC